MKKLVYTLCVCALFLTACGGKKTTDLDKLTFKEPVSSLLYGAETLNGEGRYSLLETLQSNSVEHYTFDGLHFTEGNTDPNSSIGSNVRFHIREDSTVQMVVLELYKTEEAMAVYNHLHKKLGEPARLLVTPQKDFKGMTIGYSGECWESTKEGKAYILIGYYSAFKPKVQGYELMLYILDNNDNELKNQLLRSIRF